MQQQVPLWILGSLNFRTKASTSKSLLFLPSAVGLFLSARFHFGVSLKVLSAAALPCEEGSYELLLNVDNTKWERELDEFEVEGIPHIAFLDKDGKEEGNVVGKFPKQYFLENADALACGEESISHARIVGQCSRAESRKVHQVVDPRSHG